MFRRTLLSLIIIGSFLTLCSCGVTGSALQDKGGDTGNLTKIGTPTEPVPTTGVKSQITQYISENPRWQGDITNNNKLYLKFDLANKKVMMFSTDSENVDSMAFDILDDGSIETFGNIYKLSFSNQLKELTVEDTENSSSVKLLHVDVFNICDRIEGKCEDKLSIKYVTVSNEDSYVGVYAKNKDITSELKRDIGVGTGVDPSKINLLLLK